MITENKNPAGGISRRKFLKGISTSVVALSMPNALAFRSAYAAQQSLSRRYVIREDRFGRIFPQLPPFAESSPQLEAALLEIGKPGGILDAKDNVSAGPAALIVDPALNVNNPNNDTHTAGTTFMGQFMDHDITFDLASRLGVPTPPEQSPNGRDPAFDLDSVYGGGPIADAELYERVRWGMYPTKFKVESGGLFEDLPRRGSTAIIAEPRNDENLIIAGLHAAFLLFHNKTVDLITDNRAKLLSTGSRAKGPDEVFRQARRLTTWHYQWMILTSSCRS
jgi:hypothetical protein